MARNKKVTPQDSGKDVLDLQNRIAELEGMLASRTSTPQEDIRMDELISVMSLINFPLNLSTKERGQGDIFKFERFGQVKRIVYGKLLSILEVCQRFSDWGYFLILDERVVRAHGLSEAYKSILTKDKIEKILNAESGAVELYQSSNEEQRKIIVSMIVEKLVENQNSIDLNLVDQISRISGIKILEMVEDSKKLSTLKNE